ncbi:hypothetical protein L210DRAFT_3539487 [Boletus edulis BED1]|uniref:Uncharacterized protein n=1 Tax=Boletus edulis BED1 TaxID=1328754 RepID=A0AAD4BV10_BOLED|nr:hypothetical protein L210DRAFT_3539487 [Boletus edulis BED1]
MAVGVDDWPVADSEDEDVFAQLPPADGLGASVSATTRSAVAGNVVSPDTSAIQTAFFTPDQPRIPPRGRQLPSALADGSLFTLPRIGRLGTDLSISDFTSVSSKFDALPAMAPKPRVVMKKAATSHPRIETANSSFSHISDPPISATRRTNDSIHPATTPSFGFSDAVDDAYSSFGIAERAKMRSRRSQTAKKPTYTPVQMNDVIELTSSDEDELVLKPTKRQKKQEDPAPNPKVQAKPRPKPRLKVKPVVVLPSGPSPSHTVVHDPPAPSVQCTSSQPPMSTLPTVPPSTPPQARELTPPSSPPVVTRKRKRIRPSIVEDDDEMDVIGRNFAECSPSSTMPPPFFAPASSSVPTDSGIEIPPVESSTVRGKKKQVASGKNGTQRKGPNKGKMGKKRDMISTVDETVENSSMLAEMPSTPATPHDPSFTEERHSPVTTSGKHTVTKKGKARAIDSCEEEDEPQGKLVALPVSLCSYITIQENLPPDELSSLRRDPLPKHTSTPFQGRDSSVKPKSTPMSELIRRVNSQPSSPFLNASRTYSPFLKSSRTMLSRIAPLHPNRRTPPPPLPRPPPPKKSKKQLQMEERIEEELADTIDGWSCLTDEERKALRKARVDAELGYEE